MRAELDFESLEAWLNIDPSDLAPIDLAENIDRIDFPDSDLKEESDIVSAVIEPSRLRRLVVGVAIIKGSAFF